MTTALIVDDDQDVRALFQTALRRAGFTTMMAAGADAAIHTLELNTPDIVLIDMNMPEHPGTVVLEYIRNSPHLKGVKTIVITANTQANSRAFELGADLFLVKPVTVQNMISLACRMVGLPDPSQGHPQ